MTTLTEVFNRQIQTRGRPGRLLNRDGSSVEVRFTSRRYTAQELMGDIKENDLQVRISAKDIAAAHNPIRRGFQLVDGQGVVRTFKDDPTPVYDGETLAGFIGRVRG